MNNVIIGNFTQTEDIYIVHAKETLFVVSLLSITLFFPIVIILILLLISFIAFITTLMSKDPIREKISWLLSLLISGTLTILCISAIVNTGYYTVKPEEITFVGNPDNYSA